jgi:hypothetical protein
MGRNNGPRWNYDLFKWRSVVGRPETLGMSWIDTQYEYTCYFQVIFDRLHENHPLHRFDHFRDQVGNGHVNIQVKKLCR